MSVDMSLSVSLFTDKLISTDIRKILINNTKIIYKNSNKNRLQILQAITIKNLKNHYE